MKHFLTLLATATIALFLCVDLNAQSIDSLTDQKMNAVWDEINTSLQKFETAARITMQSTFVEGSEAEAYYQMVFIGPISNMRYEISKLDNTEKREELGDWIDDPENIVDTLADLAEEHINGFDEEIRPIALLIPGGSEELDNMITLWEESLLYGRETSGMLSQLRGTTHAQDAPLMNEQDAVAAGREAVAAAWEAMAAKWEALLLLRQAEAETYYADAKTYDAEAKAEQASKAREQASKAREQASGAREQASKAREQASLWKREQQASEARKQASEARKKALIFRDNAAQNRKNAATWVGSEDAMGLKVLATLETEAAAWDRAAEAWELVTEVRSPEAEAQETAREADEAMRETWAHAWEAVAAAWVTHAHAWEAEATAYEAQSGFLYSYDQDVRDSREFASDAMRSAQHALSNASYSRNGVTDKYGQQIASFSGFNGAHCNRQGTGFGGEEKCDVWQRASDAWDSASAARQLASERRDISSGERKQQRVDAWEKAAVAWETYAAMCEAEAEAWERVAALD